MNHELRSLLTLLGVEGLDEEAAWQRVLLVLNHGCVPAQEGNPPWGFKLLLLDQRGEPEWFVRCSWATQEAMLLETSVLEALTHDEVGRRHVPEVRTAHTERIFLHLARHLGVPSYGANLHSVTESRWVGDLTEVIGVSETLMQRATTLLPSLRTQRTTADRQRAALHDLAIVSEGGGASPGAIAAIAAVLERVSSLPFMLQHGDLWPANILRGEHGWWLIDFAECGMVWVPCYDLLHMLHSAPPTVSRHWYAREGREHADSWCRARWSVLRDVSERHSLSAADVGTCLVYYLVHLTAYRLRPGVPKRWSVQLLESIERVGAFLASGGRIDDLVPFSDGAG